MAIFKPFKAYRPKPELAVEVAAKPYDVLNSEEARQEAEGHPLSFLHIGKPEIDLPVGQDLHEEIVYLKAKENLQKLISETVLVEDPAPYFYLYAQTMDGRTQYGFVGAASVDDYWNDVIKKHEKTRKDKEEDRSNHVRYTDSHSGPIFLTFHDNADLQAEINCLKSELPNTDLTSADGIRHQVWLVTGKEKIVRIEKIFADMKNLYVADGHHRSAAASIVGRERQQANPNHTGEEDYNYFLAVAFPASHLKIFDYNRVVKDLNGNTKEEFFAKLEPNFEVSEMTSRQKPAAKGQFGLYIDQKWYLMKANQHLMIDDPVEGLDVSILQNYVLDAILGIDDPRTSKRIDFVGGIRGIGELEKRVNSGEMALAFSLYPTSINELISIADAGEIMPPKSTWFEPKLRDGLFVHFM
jgi:uncharacterized protein (DUF1015 family)